MKKFFLIIVLFTMYSCSEAGIYVRLNQAGFMPLESKTAIILSDVNLDLKSYDIIDSNNKVILKAQLNKADSSYGNFKYVYFADFSEIIDEGNYKFRIEGRNIENILISSRSYNNIAETLMKFFRMQRCGYTNSEYHGVCHNSDVTTTVESGKVSSKKYDVTGGWHDAADYIKFLNTTAYSAYMLLFSYEFAPEKFSFDTNRNNVPDILEEARIGLDWLLRAQIEPGKFITQVQDLRDHEVGWRMPEDDPLQFDRPGFIGTGKNIIGVYSAALAIGSRIWKEKFNDSEYSEKLLSSALSAYNVHRNVNDIDSSGTGNYIDNKYHGKLALGASELYLTTNNFRFLSDAKKYAENAKTDFWWSWGNISPLAFYRLANYDLNYKDILKNNLEFYNNNSNAKIFGEGVSHFWGSNNTLAGIYLVNILWNKLSNDGSYNLMADKQKDYLLGRNPFGISFINGIGKKFSQKFHHQVAYFKGGDLPGGFAAGPVKKEIIENSNIEFATSDNFIKFQTEEAYYRDDIQDYITNEPTITANATAIFIFGYLSQ